MAAILYKKSQNVKKLYTLSAGEIFTLPENSQVAYMVSPTKRENEEGYAHRIPTVRLTDGQPNYHLHGSLTVVPRKGAAIILDYVE